MHIMCVRTDLIDKNKMLSANSFLCMTAGRLGNPPEKEAQSQFRREGVGVELQNVLQMALFAGSGQHMQKSLVTNASTTTSETRTH